MFRIFGFTLAAVLATAAITVAADTPSEKKACESEKFIGTYRIVSGEKDGEAIPKERLREIKVVIRKEAILTYDREDNVLYAASYTLTPAEKACHIAMKSTRPPGEGVSASGLLGEVEGRVKLIYALPDGEAPREFKTGRNQMLFVMQKTESDTDIEEAETAEKAK